MSNKIGYSVENDPELDKVKKQWVDKLSALKGLIIRDVRYMTNKEVERFDFFHSCVVLELEDGTLLWPTFDDEGSDAGALQIQVGEKSKNHGLPFHAPAIQVTWREEVPDGHAVGS